MWSDKSQLVMGRAQYLTWRFETTLQKWLLRSTIEPGNKALNGAIFAIKFSANDFTEWQK